MESRPDIINDNEFGFIYKPASDFYICNTKLLLIYIGNLNKDNFLEWINYNFITGRKYKLKEFTFIHENIDNIIYTYFLVDFGRQYKTYNKNKFQYIGKNPYIKKVKTRTNWINCIEYFQKLSKSVPEDISVDKENNGNAIGEVMVIPDRIWQKKVISYIDDLTSVNNKNISWFYDRLGKSGKTILINHLLVKSNDYIFITSPFSLESIITTINLSIKNGWSKKCIIFDISDNLDSEIFGILNQIVGIGDNGTKLKEFNLECLPVIFSNSPPNKDKILSPYWNSIYRIRSKSESGKWALNKISIDNYLSEKYEELRETRHNDIHGKVENVLEIEISEDDSI